MSKKWLIVIVCLIIFLPCRLQAVLTIEITGGSEAAVPIAILPFDHEGVVAPEDISTVISEDLSSSGYFMLLDKGNMISRPHEESEINFSDWRLLRAEGLLLGKVSSIDGETYQVQFQLFDVYKGQELLGKSYQISSSMLHSLAHTISDLVYKKLTGETGIFSTSLAFVTDMITSDGIRLYTLEVSDYHGANSISVFRSKDPILSPSWSPGGVRLSYVSFENGKADVFVQDRRTGSRRLVAAFGGINSAPAWSPDGKQLALTLSKDGDTEIYVLELATGKLTRITHNSLSIDTEPVWMPNGHELVFTSDRGGQPQIYMVSANGGSANRLTFEGGYNASPNISPDGQKMAMVHRFNRNFYVAVQNLETGSIQILTDGGRDESPSFAPNGRTILKLQETGLLMYGL